MGVSATVGAGLPAMAVGQSPMYALIDGYRRQASSHFGLMCIMQISFEQQPCVSTPNRCYVSPLTQPKDVPWNR